MYKRVEITKRQVAQENPCLFVRLFSMVLSIKLTFTSQKSSVRKRTKLSLLLEC